MVINYMYIELHTLRYRTTSNKKYIYVKESVDLLHQCL